MNEFQTHSLYADVAHLVERHLAKVEVASSSLVIRSKKIEASRKTCFYFLSNLKDWYVIAVRRMLSAKLYVITLVYVFLQIDYIPFFKRITSTTLL